VSWPSGRPRGRGRSRDRPYADAAESFSRRSSSPGTAPSTPSRSRNDPLGWTDYLLAPDFWNRTLQNWQSEFLAVGSMVVLSIDLRERGSPESKPVGEPHESIGRSG
jgi:hypothetical protein